MNNEIKGMSKVMLSNLLALGALANPTAVFAETGHELIRSNPEDKTYQFVYNKKTTSDMTDKASIYAFKLKKGLTNRGETFDPTADQIKAASVMFEAGTSEKAGEVKYDGIYELYNVQREPGLYPVVKELGEKGAMHEFKEGEGFEFPRIDEELKVSQTLELKENELLDRLEVILQNEHRFGLKGSFELSRVAEPEEVYGQFTKEELEEVFGDDISIDNYNVPETAEKANTVKSWRKLDDKVEIGTLETKEKAEKVIGVEGLEDSQLYFSTGIKDDIKEGVYVLEQKTTDVRYSTRPTIVFAVTVDEEGKSVVRFLDTAEDLDQLKKVFDEYKIHDNEQFETELEDYNALHQALLVNYPLPGFRPVDPEDPDNPHPNPEDPNIPSDPAKPEFFKSINRNADLNEDFESEYEDVLNEVVSGSEVKVNIGEIFEFDFDMYVPSNIAEYEMLQFQDFFDESVNIEKVEDKSIKIMHGDKDVTEEVVTGIEKEAQDLRINFAPEKMGDLADESIKIIIGDVYLEKGVVENVKNRGYIHYKIDEDNKTPDVPLGEKPKDPNVINPEDPTKPFNPEDPNDPGTIDPENPPTIPTTPEVVVDPINVDFRMGVVDQGTNILDDAEYRITDFVPTRGEGGIVDGKIKVGEVVYDIEEAIDASEGFVKLENLPAGKYTMKEIVAPVKGDKDYRLVTDELVFVVHEDEKHITIETPIVKNGEELTSKLIDAETLYREEPGSTVRNEENWNNPEVNDKEAMLHHYRYINTPATGTLAHIPFLVGGGVAVTAGITVGRKKKEDEEK